MTAIADPEGTARHLLERFVSLPALLGADEAAVSRAATADAAEVVTWFAEAIRATLRIEAFRGPVIDRTQALHDYLRVMLAHARHEHVRVLYLDKRLMLIREDELCEGGLDEAPIPIRTILARALDLGASALILVHNHPSGDATPSRIDIALTRRLVRAAEEFDIAICDHVVVAAGGTTSLRAEGLL